MFLLDQQQADLVDLDANEIFLGGRHHSLIPIMKEIYAGTFIKHSLFSHFWKDFSSDLPDL